MNSADLLMNYRIHGTEVFLVGSVHLIPAGITLSLEKQRSLVDIADEVVFESNLEHPPQPDCHLLQSGRLVDIIGKDLYDSVIALAVKTGYRELVDQFKPWYIGLSLSLHLQFRSGATFGGVDRDLSDYAKSTGKAMAILEGTEFWRVIDSSPISESIAALQHIVDHPQEPADQLHDIYQAWLNADIIALDAAISTMAQIMPTIHRCLFENRNRLWTKSIFQAIQDKRRAVFVVGCGHIAHGTASMQNLLQGIGFTLESVE